MADLGLDPATGDLELKAGRVRLCDGAEEVAQLWACHLTLFRGEWFLDRSLGIDYQHDVLEKGVPAPVLRAVFTNATREIARIADARDLRLSLDRVTRTLRVSIDASLNTGESVALALSETVGE